MEENSVRVAGARAGGIRGAGEHLITGGEGAARRYGEEGLQAGQAVAVVVGRGFRERFQRWKAFSGSLIHAGLDPLDALRVRGLSFFDRARCGPRTPPGRLFYRPAGDVQVEGAYRDEQQGPVSALNDCLGDGAVWELAPLDAGA